MANLPSITVTTVDRAQLYALLERQQEDSDEVEHLYAELERATIVPPEELPKGTVCLGSRVQFRELASGKTHQRVLVLPHDTATHADAISILSPAGAALLGLSVGDIIEWPYRNRTLQLELLDVLPPETD
ncbi:GreA/GreB family elongation factor [Alcanivorax nanhaiticus]|uniref:GreA/GreB family elongation factor n=1 Tax=Alcanivorax nanhaiticus TaxID=1177154 RepID=A0A095UTY6_9GAMM|nr:nucleoside diphosphate kinase regulator [Alcanivorax nanhaiticus]KGD66005.1 GreA/GreB family elongation factor [Alcanivorax nanhaiticus]